MSRVRHGHACGIINYDTILVAGGKDSFGSLLTFVEMFSLITLKWDDSTHLPNPVGSGASLQFGSTLLVFGRTSIFQFDETSYEWFVRDETILSERADYLTLPITGMHSLSTMHTVQF